MWRAGRPCRGFVYRAADWEEHYAEVKQHRAERNTEPRLSMSTSRLLTRSTRRRDRARSGLRLFAIGSRSGLSWDRVPSGTYMVVTCWVSTANKARQCGEQTGCCCMSLCSYSRLFSFLPVIMNNFAFWSSGSSTDKSHHAAYLLLSAIMKLSLGIKMKQDSVRESCYGKIINERVMWCGSMWHGVTLPTNLFYIQ